MKFEFNLHCVSTELPSPINSYTYTNFDDIYS